MEQIGRERQSARLLRGIRARRPWLLRASVAAGFACGLVITLFRGVLVPEQFERDALKIWMIASGQLPNFSDQAFTPVANVYRFLGIGDAPTAAAAVGYLAACAVILLALVRCGRRAVSLPTATLIFAAFLLSGLYLGQYSKDVFVLVPVALAFLPRRAWWDVATLAAMLLYAFFFRDYWAIVAVGYAAFRLLTIRQVRMRYLLLIGSLAATAAGLGIHIALNLEPNHFRTSVQGYLEANTLIHPVEFLAQPLGGLVDIFVNYWLILTPLTLPFYAGPAYVLVVAGLMYVRLLPLVAARSSRAWPSNSTKDGAFVRRAIAMLCAFAVVQALFEPDYGSVLRHLTPLLALGIAAVVCMSDARRRTPAATRWNWSGAPRTAANEEQETR